MPKQHGYANSLFRGSLILLQRGSSGEGVRSNLATPKERDYCISKPPALDPSQKVYREAAYQLLRTRFDSLITAAISKLQASSHLDLAVAEVQQAQEVAAIALKQCPENREISTAQTYVLLSQIHYKMGARDKAKTEMQVAYKLDPMLAPKKKSALEERTQQLQEHVGGFSDSAGKPLTDEAHRL